jgi:hypothetical protein
MTTQRRRPPPRDAIALLVVKATNEDKGVAVNRIEPFSEGQLVRCSLGRPVAGLPPRCAHEILARGRSEIMASVYRAADRRRWVDSEWLGHRVTHFFDNVAAEAAAREAPNAVPGLKASVAWLIGHAPESLTARKSPLVRGAFQDWGIWLPEDADVFVPVDKLRAELQNAITNVAVPKVLVGRHYAEGAVVLERAGVLGHAMGSTLLTLIYQWFLDAVERGEYRLAGGYSTADIKAHLNLATCGIFQPPCSAQVPDDARLERLVHQLTTLYTLQRFRGEEPMRSDAYDVMQAFGWQPESLEWRELMSEQLQLLTAVTPRAPTVDPRRTIALVAIWPVQNATRRIRIYSRPFWAIKELRRHHVPEARNIEGHHDLLDAWDRALALTIRDADSTSDTAMLCSVALDSHPHLGRRVLPQEYYPDLHQYVFGR